VRFHHKSVWKNERKNKEKREEKGENKKKRKERKRREEKRGTFILTGKHFAMAMTILHVNAKILSPLS
jgi:hypothetical protein